MKSIFAQNLKEKRIQFHWTQERAAMEISIKTKEIITQTRYQNWEKGESEPKFKILIAIAELFLIDDLYLFLKKPVYQDSTHTSGIPIILDLTL